MPASASPRERDAARREIPEPLRRDVGLLGRLLGQVIAEQGGAELLDDVEKLRRLVIGARASARREREAEALVASWSVKRAEQVARAFTCYFHLANLAEEHHRARVLRERESGPEPMPESLAATMKQVLKGMDEDAFIRMIDRLTVYPVFTAHPTEARRRAVVTAINRIGEQLERGDEERLLEEIDILWRTGQLRSTELHPLDEVRALMAIFDETLFRVVPEVCAAFQRAVSPEDGRYLGSFLRFGSWVGGDRDGNPFVTAQVTEETMAIQAEHTLLALENAVTRIGRSLTLDESTTRPSKRLKRELAKLAADDPERMAEIAKRSPSEPHRQFMLHVADRIRATRTGGGRRYQSAVQLLSDLKVVGNSLDSAGARRIERGQLQRLVWQVMTFGFHFASLEVRQHSAQLTDNEETLEIFRAMKRIQDRYGIDACRRFIVSFTRSADDVANVYRLAAKAVRGRPPIFDVVPLFETQEALEGAVAIVDEIFKLARPGDRRLEVMLGYSDSAKESGPVSATFSIYAAQDALARWARQNDVDLTIFHGRGGGLGRGGGPANRAILAQAPGSLAYRFKVTEQGEVIFARYGNPAIARRHLEQVMSATILASTPRVQASVARAARRFRQLGETVSTAARAAYRGLVDREGFDEWFALVSPIDELGRMRIGSRPARRAAGHRLEDLRAIPWVFAWSQMRLNLPGWYGLGSGLEAVPMDRLREAYRSWPLFNVMVDNAEMSLSKTDRKIAARYLALGDRPDLTDRVLDEYDRTLAAVLAVTGHSRLLENRRVLSWAVELRNPYVDALSHLQLRALRALRARRGGAAAEQLLMLTVNGVAAGLQNTG